MPLQGPCGACEGRRPQRGIAGCRAPFLPVPLRRPGGAQRSTPHYAPSFLGERRLVVYVYFDRSLLNSFHKGRWRGGGVNPPVAPTTWEQSAALCLVALIHRGYQAVAGPSHNGSPWSLEHHRHLAYVTLKSCASLDQELITCFWINIYCRPSYKVR